MNILVKIKQKVILFYFFIINRLKKKGDHNIMFVPHANASSDNYDLLNNESDNVLCFLNNLLRDHKYDDYHFYIGYYDRNKLNQYLTYCSNFKPERLHFYLATDIVSLQKSLCNCSLIFTDETFRKYRIKTKSQRIVCLNYYAGFMKNDYYRILNHGGYKRMLKEQNNMHNSYDKIISTSDISAMFLSVEDCMYYGDILPLGFPRNDIFYQDNSELRKRIESIIQIPFDKIFTYVPTHRDYENESRKDFYDKDSMIERSIFGPVSESQLQSLEETLEKNNSIIIAKVHPVQARGILKCDKSSKRIIYYHDLVTKITTSLNPLMAISDFLITDYTTAVYDYMHADRPIIYYFYDIDKYVGSRGLFIDPIEPICAGEIVYDIENLCKSIDRLCNGGDSYKFRRRFITDLLIKYRDGNSCERIKEYFLS